MKTPSILIILAFILLPAIPTQAQDIYEIPAGFRGQITIFVREECGEKIAIEDGRFVIRIPESGLLILQGDKLDEPYPTELGTVRHDPNVYIEVDNESRTELPHLDDDRFEKETETEYTPDDIGVFHRGSGGSSFDGKEATFYYLFVGSYNDLKSYEFSMEFFQNRRDTLFELIRCRG